jgi:hypothetical protein
MILLLPDAVFLRPQLRVIAREDRDVLTAIAIDGAFTTTGVVKSLNAPFTESVTVLDDLPPQD